MFIQEAQQDQPHIWGSVWLCTYKETQHGHVHTVGSTWLCSYRRLNMAMPRFLALSLIYLNRQIFQTNQTCSFIGRCWQIKKDWGFWKLWRLLQRASMLLEDYLNKTFEKEDKEYNLLGSKTNKGNQGNQTQERKHRKLIASLAVN